MHHIEVLAYGTPPCNGEVRLEQTTAERRRALPLYGGPERPETRIWVCARCGKRWEREPSPQEVL
jgi:hypothetical protein